MKMSFSCLLLQKEHSLFITETDLDVSMMTGNRYDISYLSHDFNLVSRSSEANIVINMIQWGKIQIIPNSQIIPQSAYVNYL